jgi:hypothetical protein
LTLDQAIKLLLLSDLRSNGNQSARDNRDLFARAASLYKQALFSSELPAFNSTFAVATN